MYITPPTKLLTRSFMSRFRHVHESQNIFYIVMKPRLVPRQSTHYSCTTRAREKKKKSIPEIPLCREPMFLMCPCGCCLWSIEVTAAPHHNIASQQTDAPLMYLRGIMPPQQAQRRTRNTDFSWGDAKPLNADWFRTARSKTMHKMHRKSCTFESLACKLPG